MTFLRPGENVWRTARADRFAIFNDVAGCFGAMRQSMRRAEQSITIVGWDIDSRTRLVGPTGDSDDDLPCELRPFLEALKQRKPDLQINLLLWDFAAIYALEREAFPRVKLAWDGAKLVLDSCLPIGSSQHQKLVVIDNSLAFSGGLDVTIRRWDTSEHLYRNPHRVDPQAEPYNPFHDVQAVVDGDAARALSDLVGERWKGASGDRLITGSGSAKWPEGVDPLFRDVEVGIARTVPVQDGLPEVREAERLFFDMIDWRRGRSISRTSFSLASLLPSGWRSDCGPAPTWSFYSLRPRPITRGWRRWPCAMAGCSFRRSCTKQAPRIACGLPIRRCATAAIRWTSWCTARS